VAARTFALAHYRVYQDRETALRLPRAAPAARFYASGLGNAQRNFDGDAPFTPAGASRKPGPLPKFVAGLEENADEKKPSHEFKNN